MRVEFCLRRHPFLICSPEPTTLQTIRCETQAPRVLNPDSVQELHVAESSAVQGELLMLRCKSIEFLARPEESLIMVFL